MTLKLSVNLTFLFRQCPTHGKWKEYAYRNPAATLVVNEADAEIVPTPVRVVS